MQAITQVLNPFAGLSLRNCSFHKLLTAGNLVTAGTMVGAAPAAILLGEQAARENDITGQQAAPFLWSLIPVSFGSVLALSGLAGKIHWLLSIPMATATGALATLGSAALGYAMLKDDGSNRSHNELLAIGLAGTGLCSIGGLLTLLGQTDVTLARAFYNGAVKTFPNHARKARLGRLAGFFGVVCGTAAVGGLATCWGYTLYCGLTPRDGPLY